VERYTSFTVPSIVPTVSPTTAAPQTNTLVMTPVTTAPTKSEYIIKNADGSELRVEIAELGMILRFEVPNQKPEPNT